MTPLRISELATENNFDEEAYLRANPDVRNAVEQGSMPSARLHFDMFGAKERRSMVWEAPAEARQAKMSRLKNYLRTDMPSEWRDGRADFLSEELRIAARIAPTTNVSSNAYDPGIISLIEKYPDGLLLDCGAGSRPEYYSNVVNFEIVPYPSTDVLGIGEVLPFKDNTFDAVISVAVLEHVADPIKCAAEICRVLKPGGDLFCCLPFLQPLHGYPHHYFNATPQGLRRLFDVDIEISDIYVNKWTHPLIAVQWILGSWANGLHEITRSDFEKMTVGELLQGPLPLLEKPFATELTKEKLLELACASILTGRKRPEC